MCGRSLQPLSKFGHHRATLRGVETTQQAPWLSEEELPTWLALIGVLIKLPAALDEQLQRDAGMNHFEHWALMGLSRREGHSMRMSELAVLTNGSLSRLSQVISRLEKRGYVRRAPDPTDGRCTLAILTEAGMNKLLDTTPGHVEEVRRLVFEPLTKAQARQLREILHRIIRTIVPDLPDGEPDIRSFRSNGPC
jgi:DNA-binding MarR family transcriptional regulator